MTPGHKHRYIRVTKGSLLYRVLKKPLWHCKDRAYVERSRLVFGGPCQVEDHRSYDGCYVLTLLSLLHTFTGLTIRTGSTWKQTKKRAGK